jgi:predicted TIM-barrel fold metal-dependent hydrolase
MIIDAQVHLWEADRPDRPWPPYHHLGTHHPEADPPVDAREQLVAMDAIGVDRAIIVPPSWAGETNESAMEWATEYPDRFKIMGLFDIADADAPERLETWLDQPGMLGIRAGSSPRPGKPWMDPDTYPWFWSTAERLGIPIMISPTPNASALGPIAARHPDLTLIIDHLGLSPHWALHPDEDPVPDRNFFGPGFEQVLDQARHPRVMVKFSSLPLVSKEPYPYRDLAAHLERAFKAYGRDRIMWGSDYSVLKSAGIEYRHCLDHVRVGLDFLSDSDREAILGGTAANALHWQV